MVRKARWRTDHVGPADHSVSDIGCHRQVLNKGIMNLIDIFKGSFCPVMKIVDSRVPGQNVED